MNTNPFRGSAQPSRGKLTRSKLRALRILHRSAAPVALERDRGVARQTIRALLGVGLIVEVATCYYRLTPAGRTAADRYAPRHRSSLPLPLEPAPV